MDDFNRYEMNEPDGNYGGKGGCLDFIITIVGILFTLYIFSLILD